MNGAYYNEIDPYAAQWLRNLIAAGHIAPGDVDERSIVNVRPDDLRGYRQCHFFAGIGVWSYALRLAGWPDEEYVWTASLPCQPFSIAGGRLGFADDRHVWADFARLCEKRRPQRILGEQVSSPDGLAWLDLILSGLETLGYACAAIVATAAGVGAPHARPRTYWVADTERERVEGHGEGVSAGEAGPWGSFGEKDLHAIAASPHESGRCWPRPIVRKMGDGTTRCVGRLRAYGNAIVPQVAAEFIRAYREVRLNSTLGDNG